MSIFIKQDLHIYNSISSKKEKFTPLSPKSVGMYVCGPTVYSNVHLGNVRTFVSFDTIFRYFKHLGYKVRYVRNITDVGHLENDSDEGEDRIVKKARLEHIEPMEVVQRYTIDFHNVLQQLNCLPPSIEPTATGHILEQIRVIGNIINQGFAYQVNGSVYFDVLKYNKHHHYGILSHRDIEDLIHNTRDLGGQSDKKNPQDFALWKKAEPRHIMRWSSPWSDGFPGWHLECTAMSNKYLGDRFDIHGGGMDLKFPHHECEIAQATVSNGKNPVNYWIHTNMLTLNGKKMAKSTGNNILPKDIFSGGNDILEKPFSPITMRFFMQQAHYRSVLDFSNEAILASEKGCDRLMTSINLLKNLPRSEVSEVDVKSLIEKCYESMNDDFNTPLLIAQLFEISKVIHRINDGKLKINSKDLLILTASVEAFVYDVLGLRKSQKDYSDKLPKVIDLLVKLREKSRSNKDFTTSDLIRRELEILGIQIKDSKDGTTFSISN